METKLASPSNRKRIRTAYKSQNGHLKHALDETRTVTGSELFSLLTCPHTTIFTLLSIFSSLGMSTITNLGDNTILACEIVSSGCRSRLKNARAAQIHEKRKELASLCHACRNAPPRDYSTSGCYACQNKPEHPKWPKARIYVNP